MRSEPLWENEDVTEWLLDTLLPDGGYVSVQLEVYFDESGTHARSPVMCVAGYIFEKEQAKKLAREWRITLKDYSLPYFRMSECAHGNGPFKSLTPQQRIDIETRMITLIKRRSVQGIAISMNASEYKELMPEHQLIGDDYAFLTHVAACGLRRFVEINPGVDKIAYFYETGHKSQGRSNALLSSLFENEQSRRLHRYASHSFVTKDSSGMLQAADLLAWQAYTDKRKQIEGTPRRRDYASLLEHSHTIEHLGREKLAELSSSFNELIGA